ncbi:MAG: phosphoribosyltransferase family protein [Nitrososphaerota archaeon]
MNKLASAKMKIFAVEILRVLKRNYTYKEISKMIDLPPSVLSRYINGHVIPSVEKAEMIIEAFSEKYIRDILRSKVMERNGAYDLTSVCYDTSLQQLIAKSVVNEFEFVKVDKILTAAVDGIPLAIQLGNELGVKAVVVAKGTKEVGVEEFFEEKAMFSPVLFKTFYIPKGSIKKDENVLIVDDIVRTGATVEAMIRFVERSKAKVVGIFTIFSVNNSAEELKKKLGLKCKVLSFLKLS